MILVQYDCPREEEGYCTNLPAPMETPRYRPLRLAPSLLQLEEQYNEGSK